MRKTKKKVNILPGGKLQIGGTLFTIKSDDLKTLWHVGKGPGANISCAACVLNQLNFPIELVDQLSKSAATGNGITWVNINRYINEVKNKLTSGKGAPSNIYSWGVGKNYKLSVVPINNQYTQWPFTTPGTAGVMRYALEQVFNTVKPGTATVLGMTWINQRHQDKDEGGHYVVIAKSNRGTPYLIETQNSRFQGIYRTMPEIIQYFHQGFLNVAYFITFNNSQPRLDRGIWNLPDNELVLTLPQRNPKILPKNVDKRRSLDLHPSFLQRFGSFTSVDQQPQKQQQQWQPQQQKTVGPMVPVPREIGQYVQSIKHRAIEDAKREGKELDERSMNAVFAEIKQSLITDYLNKNEWEQQEQLDSLRRSMGGGNRTNKKKRKSKRTRKK